MNISRNSFAAVAEKTEFSKKEAEKAVAAVFDNNQPSHGSR